jgi:hypothetical protein
MLKKFQTNFLILLMALVLGACSMRGAVRLEDQRIPLEDIIKTVQNNLPGGLKKFSQNGREHTSNYFARGKDGTFVPAGSSPVRHFAFITILGDRRPYDIEIRVFTEKRASTGQFDQVGQDEGLARVVSRRIDQALHKGREGRNLIDDFKPF